MNLHLPNKHQNSINSRSLSQKVALLFIIFVFSFLPFDAMSQCWDFTCFENTEISLNSNCERTGNPTILLVNPLQCASGPKEIVFFDENGDPIGDTVGEEHLDLTVPYLITNVWTGDYCFGNITVRDTRGPDIDCQNISIKCNEDFSPEGIGTPYAVDNCTFVASLTYTDAVIDFGCGEQGFQGYFDPENWTTCIVGSDGDGGVDVTGAPNSISVEGADNSPISDNCPYVTRYKIEIPTEGYVSFDWTSFGGSAFDHENAFFTIGDTCVQLTTVNELTGETTTSGSFTSWLIPAGYWVSFEVTSNGNLDNMTTVFENFQFITPAIKVINRTWVGYDAYQNQGSCTQIITLERTYLDDVLFPENRDGVEAPLLECGASTDPTFTEPNYTGYPFLDEDGNLATTADQTPFVGSTECHFDVFHNDIIIPDCDGNYTVARTWTVLDNCTGNTREDVQIIRVADTMPPVITCPVDYTISTNDFDCTAIIPVPSYTAVDACSSNLIYSSSWAFGTGQNSYSNVTVGTHTLTVNATDGCGNTAECTVNITVEDQVAPQVICDAFTAAAVMTEGESIVFAESLDDGSYDFCCANNQLLFEVKLDDAPDTEYAPTLVFDCGYVGGSAAVNMRVTDCNGNSNYCTVQVDVQDNEAPAVFCPADQTVDCGTDLSDLSVFGTAQAQDNCGFEIDENIETSLNSCGLGTVVRSYLITDLSGNISTCSQTISIENLTPWNENEDQINFPPNFSTVGDCETNVLPDDLNAPYDYPTYDGVIGCEQPAWSYDDEVFDIAEPACFSIIRTWSVMDWCGNGAIYSGVQIIEVQDNIAPVFDELQSDITVTLSGANNCTANVTLSPPNASDCSPDVFVSMSGDLGNSFGNIEDIGMGEYEVIYTATDGCGNSETHSFMVSVEDNSVPQITCPFDIIVDCGADLSDLETFGMPTVIENCSMDSYTISETVEESINDCGLGFVKRSWAVADGNNNTNLCEQYIYIENETPWNDNNTLISFPADYLLTGDCGLGTQPEDLPAPYDFPEWSGEDACAFIEVSFEDETIMVSPPNCYEIIRTWTITDVCNLGQSWTNTQVITIEDNEAPVFIDAPITYTLAPNNAANCSVNVEIPVPQIEECDPNASIVLEGDLSDGFGYYDLTVGTYDLTYSATDGCGNNTIHSYQIIVVDDIAPEAICLSGLTLDIPQELELEVTAITMNAASYDNCDLSYDLDYSFSADINDQTLLINCENLGNTTVTIWVTDAAGNQSTCSTFIQVNDDNDYCNPEPPMVIAPDIFGNIINWEFEPVALVDVQLMNSGLGAYQTAELGLYEYLDMTTGNDYTVVPVKDINDLNGVTTLDVSKLSDHVENIQLLTNPYQMIAGDADNSNDLTSSDVSEIENAILFNEDGFLWTTSWRFVDANYVFPISTNPLENGYPKNIEILDLQSDKEANFIGVKTGDLNGTSNPLGLMGEDSEERDGDDLILQVTDQDLVSGNDYLVTFTAKGITEFLAYQFSLDFDANALIINELYSEELPFIADNNFGKTLLSQGALTTLWFNKTHQELPTDQAAFSIAFTAQTDGLLSDFLNISSRFTPAISYYKDESAASVQLEFVEEQTEEPEEPEISTEYELFQNQPNPFDRKTRIGFNVPVESEVTFTFYDLRGIELYSVRNTYAAGYHQLELLRENLGSNIDEMILYKMESGDFKAAKKMVVMRQ